MDNYDANAHVLAITRSQGLKWAAMLNGRKVTRIDRVLASGPFADSIVAELHKLRSAHLYASEQLAAEAAKDIVQ